MQKFDYDLFVIGAGSGGIRTARIASSLGARVAIAEKKYLGGTCVNVGCVPKKIFFYASHLATDIADAKAFGWELNPPIFNWETLITNKNKEIARLNDIYADLLKNANVKLIQGHATLADPHNIIVNDKIYSCERILIATGGTPYIPNIHGKQHAISSNEVFFLNTLPEKIIIVGGGYIAVEFAGIFNALGVETTLVHRGELFLKKFDQDIREFLKQEMEKKGITLRFNNQITSIEKIEQKSHATLTCQTKLVADQIMFATGRKPNIAALQTEQLGIRADQDGAIIVDHSYQTNIPSIYAIGDVTNRINLTPVALAEGTLLAHSLYGKEKKTMNYENIPSAIFSQPNIGTVGLTEQIARGKYPNCAIYKTTFTPMQNSMPNNHEKIFMKLIVDQKTDKIIGAHMVGKQAGEIIQGIAIAIKAGVKKSDLDQTLGIHPTIAEEFCSMQKIAQ